MKRSRARFVEEWRADLVAARALGLSQTQIVSAAAQVAVFLLVVRVRAAVKPPWGRAQLVGAGLALGFVLAVVDVPLDAAVPFVVLALGWWVWRAVRAWIDGVE